MSLRYFISARSLSGKPAWLAEELDADSFLAAVQLAKERCIARFGVDNFRLTSVVEMPRIDETGPLAIASHVSALAQESGNDAHFNALLGKGKIAA